MKTVLGLAAALLLGACASGSATQTPASAAETAPVNDTNIDRVATPDEAKMSSDDVLTAAEGTFGKGAAGLAEIIEDILRDQGTPVGYIRGSEASGALVIGARYGSGTLHHKVEGERKVFWTGPSIGFDAGADANKVFVLVYNLHDAEQLFRHYPAVEGKAYALGGFTAAYLRRGDVALVPVRLGAGLRLGANVGYMRFRKKGSWIPF